MIKLIHILIISATLWGGYLFSQCQRPSQVISPDYKDGWGENSQSKSGHLRPGDHYEMRFIAQAGIKYRIKATAGSNEFSEDNISFQLVVKEVNHIEKDGKVTYKSSEVILYDSELAGEGEEAIILTSKAQSLSIKVKIDDVNVPAFTTLCAIVLIEAKKAKIEGLK